MSNSSKNSVWVIGHKNPDTDSICAAIAYANLKNRTCSGDTFYEAVAAGDINSETKYVLDFFGVRAPRVEDDVRACVRDINIRHTEPVRESLTLKRAWELMKAADVVTLPVVDEKNKVIGLVSNNDIAKNFMEDADENRLSIARAHFADIAATLGGEILAGNGHSYFTKGKVWVAAGSEAAVNERIRQDDLVLVGDRVDIQKILLDKNVSCMIVCGSSVDAIERDIIEIAEAKECVLISTKYDTYLAASLINQSMPLKSIMTGGKLVKFYLDSKVDDVKEVMSKERHRDFPVLDEKGYYAGMISRRNFLGMKKKQIILVDHNEKSQAVEGVEEAEIVEIIDHHRLGSLETITPVFFRNQPVGSTATIVSLMYDEAHVEPDEKTAGLMCAAILSDTLMFKSPTCTYLDEAVCDRLARMAGIVIPEFATNMFRAGSNFASKKIEEIAGADFKIFNVKEHKIGIGQVMGMDAKGLGEVKARLKDYLPLMLGERGVDVVYIILTNILDADSEVVGIGQTDRNTAAELIAKSFGVEYTDCAFLKGLVSRKKQFAPVIIQAVTEE